jgi:ferrochelatase
MRYGAPSIADALDRLAAAGAERIVVAMQYPQHAESSRGTALAAVSRWAARRAEPPKLLVLPPFFATPGFVAAVAAAARPLLAEQRPEHVLMSYHSLPERHVLKADPSREHCLARAECCRDPGAVDFCYRAQCLATSRAVAEALDLARCLTSFQSRWLRVRRAGHGRSSSRWRPGVRRLLVLCPSFVADCLETLEEIAIAIAGWSCTASFAVAPA